jgi:hypothetical protein
MTDYQREIRRKLCALLIMVGPALLIRLVPLALPLAT